jgi:hypothetical protein
LEWAARLAAQNYSSVFAEFWSMPLHGIWLLCCYYDYIISVRACIEDFKHSFRNLSRLKAKLRFQLAVAQQELVNANLGLDTIKLCSLSLGCINLFAWPGMGFECGDILAVGSGFDANQMAASRFSCIHLCIRMLGLEPLRARVFGFRRQELRLMKNDRCSEHIHKFEKVAGKVCKRTNADFFQAINSVYGYALGSLASGSLPGKEKFLFAPMALKAKRSSKDRNSP